MSQAAGTDRRVSRGDLHEELAEFAELNRRRVFGSPGLSVSEVERWVELCSGLESYFDARQPERRRTVEQREFLRVPTHIRIEFGSGGDLESGILSDVSDGGLFIACSGLLELGSPVSLTLTAGESGAPIELTGTVVRTREEARPGAPAGMGVTFTDLSADQRHALEWLVRKSSEAIPASTKSC